MALDSICGPSGQGTGCGKVYKSGTEMLITLQMGI